MNQPDKKIIDKIKKLFAMVNGGSIHEKQTALLQAQRLMAKHHIEESHLESHSKEDVLSLSVPEINVRKKIYQYLAFVISKNFRSKVYYSYNSQTYLWPVFMGQETDVKIAKESFIQAFEFMNKEANRIAAYHSYHHGTAKGVRGEWIFGFVNGLDEGFKAQIQSSKETSLMQIVPEVVEENYASMSFAPNENAPKDLDVARNGDVSLFDAGYNNGYEFANGRKQESISNTNKEKEGKI